MLVIIKGHHSSDLTWLQMKITIKGLTKPAHTITSAPLRWMGVYCEGVGRILVLPVLDHGVDGINKAVLWD